MLYRPILIPTTVLAAWTAVFLWAPGIVELIAATALGIPLARVMRWTRLRTVEEGGPRPGAWIGHDSARLLEAPVLFYATEIVLAISGKGTPLDSAAGWFYVCLRIAHSIGHVLAIDRRAVFLISVCSGIVLQVIVLRSAYSMFH
jgi:hypothetical protein